VQLIYNKMAKDTRTPEEILEAEIKEARQSVLNTVNPSNGPTGVKGPKSEVADDRTTKRLMKRQLDQLDFIVEKFLKFRAELECTDGLEAAEGLAYYDRIWHTQCTNFNKRRKHKFNLRQEAFTDRVSYFLDLEDQQIKAAKEAYRTNLFEKWFRRTWIDMSMRRKWYRFKARFVKKSFKEMFRDYWETLETLPHKPPTFEV